MDFMRFAGLISISSDIRQVKLFQLTPPFTPMEGQGEVEQAIVVIP